MSRSFWSHSVHFSHNLVITQKRLIAERNGRNFGSLGCMLNVYGVILTLQSSRSFGGHSVYCFQNHRVKRTKICAEGWVRAEGVRGNYVCTSSLWGALVSIFNLQVIPAGDASWTSRTMGLLFFFVKLFNFQVFMIFVNMGPYGSQNFKTPLSSFSPIFVSNVVKKLLFFRFWNFDILNFNELFSFP